MAKESNVVFLIGEKIRKYRQHRGLTQKQLADKCGISESAIRNYELGNRYPDEETILNIADSLEMDRSALRDPDPSDIFSAEHILMDFEQLYGIVPKMVDGELHFVFTNPPEDISNADLMRRLMFKDSLLTWCAYRDALTAGTITEEEYFEWLIAHSDNMGDPLPVEHYRLTLDEEVRMEKARRAEGFMPVPVWDENHKNVLPIPKTKKDPNKPNLEEQRLEELTKTKRKRKPKI